MDVELETANLASGRIRQLRNCRIRDDAADYSDRLHQVVACGRSNCTKSRCLISTWFGSVMNFGLRADVLLPHEVTGDDPPPRFFLNRDGETYPLLDLRALVPTVRKIGEKGIRITRFKGLGEMDAEQLWETTMDPARRTLFQVRLDDVAAANDLFATLMGDDVEPRREFIEKHALEVKNLDV